MKKTTARDVATQCGVSQATVSYVLNNRADKTISEETRTKILVAARELSYYPNAHAQGMRLQRSQSIGIVVDRNVLNLSINETLRGIKKVLYANGYSITLLPDDEIAGEHAQYLSYYLSRRVDGILFLYLHPDDESMRLLNKHGIPYLAINENGIEGCGIYIKTGLAEVILSFVEYCRNNNFTSLGFIDFSRDIENMSVKLKYELLEAMLAEHFPSARLTFYPIPPALSDDDERRTISDIIDGNKVELLFTSLPRLTLLTQGVILEKRFALPQHIKLIGLSESRFFDAVYPSITHIDFSLNEMGQFACLCLINYLSGLVTQASAFKCKIKWRQSSSTVHADEWQARRKESLH